MGHVGKMPKIDIDRRTSEKVGENGNGVYFTRS